MAQERRQKDHVEADDAVHPQSSGESASQAQETSTEADELIDDIDALLDDVDRSIRATLGFGPGDVVDTAELERRAAEMVAGYQQKGGQ